MLIKLEKILRIAALLFGGIFILIKLISDDEGGQKEKKDTVVAEEFDDIW